MISPAEVRLHVIFLCSHRLKLSIHVAKLGIGEPLTQAV